MLIYMAAITREGAICLLTHYSLVATLVTATNIAIPTIVQC